MPRHAYRPYLSVRPAQLCSRWPARLFLAILLPATGCVDSNFLPALEYVSHVAAGQSGVVVNTESIDDAKNSGRLIEEQIAKLDLAVRAREYAVNQMGLKGDNAYTTFLDTGDAPLAYNLTAAYQDRLEPLTWTFLIVGTLPYLAFFDEDYLLEYEQQLIDAGFDTMTYELDAYSTLGVFEDPIRSPMLRRNVVSLSDTIIHELLHNTIYANSSVTFNESMATFVGRTGALEFIEIEYGPDSTVETFARNYYADLDKINAFLFRFRTRAQAYYAQELSSAELIAGREEFFAAARQEFADEILPTLNYPDSYTFYAEFPTNNAWLLANFRYNLNLDQFEEVFAALDGDWSATLDVFRAAARSSGNPFDYLESWLAENGPADQLELTP